MKILNNEPLSKYTTIRLGGIAEKMYIPETAEELVELLRKETIQYILGGGSNLLIADRTFDKVLNLRHFDDSLISYGDGKYHCGASLRLQKLVSAINANGYGGIEYLCTVPGLVGGAVAMNAGTGKDQGLSISDHIVSVTVLELKSMKVITLSKEQCNFTHRNSLFKNNGDYIILSCDFIFHEQPLEESKRLCDAKREYTKKYHDTALPNFGSVFSVFNPYLLAVVSKLQLGDKNGIHFSGKTMNWIVNSNMCNSSKKAFQIIGTVKKMHKLCFQKCKVEVVMWR